MPLFICYLNTFCNQSFYLMCIYFMTYKGWTGKDGSLDRKGRVPGPERTGPWTGKDGSPSPTLGTIIKKSYDGSSVLSTSLGSKTVNNTSSSGLGGTKI